jgi:hypothetical protein
MANQDRASKWRQGSFVSSDALVALGLCSPDGVQSRVGIVATHDCDLVQSLEAEPNVEIILGSRIQKLEGNCTHAKSARRLHLPISGKAACFAEFVAVEKHTVSKEQLNQFTPDPSLLLGTAEATTYRGWLADRYMRSAFPDEFEKRLQESKVAEKLKASAKRYGQSVTAILFDVETREDRGDQLYVLDVVVLHGDEPDYEKAADDAKSMVAEIKRDFAAAFKMGGNWSQVELRFVDPISESALTLATYKLYKRWRLDYLSYAGSGALPQ